MVIILISKLVSIDLYYWSGSIPTSDTKSKVIPPSILMEYNMTSFLPLPFYFIMICDFSEVKIGTEIEYICK